ncbi:hypothetical protein F5B20DRAFT_525066 [Whalleya microplaca]|nr:hypothetical protein F5B20DRAFT_525066 [Whalleya microplaca]
MPRRAYYLPLACSILYFPLFSQSCLTIYARCGAEAMPTLPALGSGPLDTRDRPCLPVKSPDTYSWNILWRSQAGAKMEDLQFAADV